MPLLSDHRHRLRQQPSASRTAYEKITADVIARYKRLAAFDAHFLMGNDEHSQNVFKKAIEQGLRSARYSDRMEQEFRRSGRN